jgi:hypothetical protein
MHVLHLFHEVLKPVSHSYLELVQKVQHLIISVFVDGVFIDSGFVFIAFCVSHDF